MAPATAIEPMRINVWNGKNTLVYKQFISIPKSAQITDSADSGTGNLIVSTTNPYHFVKAEYNDQKIPGGAYITDADHNAIAIVARDGNIYIFDSLLTLSLLEKD